MLSYFETFWAWIMNQIIISSVLKILISYLRKLASASDNEIDDAAVDFVEFVFQALGWITPAVAVAPAPVTQAVKK